MLAGQPRFLGDDKNARRGSQGNSLVQLAADGIIDDIHRDQEPLSSCFRYHQCSQGAHTPAKCCSR